MKDPGYVLDTDNESSIALKDNLLKYLSKWPWFVISVVLCLFFGYLYVRYASIVYASEAKIKIIDDSKEFDIATDALSLLGGGSKINLDNEIAVIKSYRLLDQVVSSLNLDIEYYESGTLKHQQIFEAPFLVSKLFPENSLEKTMVYHVSLTDKDMKITDLEGQVFTMDSSAISFTKADFPIQMTRNANVDFESSKNRDYFVQIHNKKETVLNLIKTLTVEPITTDSDVLSIGMHSESPKLAETILNEIVTTFNEDGIMDRQLVSKRTLDFIDDRFLYLSARAGLY
ncbi:hypothetical protein N7U66_13475 [Lacinutrix neustonica]|uniref:Polysaccharide chain length determinant N-terminal domain-containing protein n=1 Tax=Lacinutrix neustonica TaxID=2980107 RepID=A0A9E8SDF8_9FLAO|nr:hypothetical protein [Lacinutrix neustonica]WAC01159.1 hypothetical protein N7U66_13475 [Lacinutrix neustonica]